jgi:hypothetical protein
MAFLARQGFDYGTIESVITKIGTSEDWGSSGAVDVAPGVDD